jgi:uncharacterized protein
MARKPALRAVPPPDPPLVSRLPAPRRRAADSLRELAARLRARGAPISRPARFEPAEPPPGVVPEGAVTLAGDDALCQGEALGWAARVGFADLYGEGLGFVGYPALAQLQQRPEFRRFAEIFAEEMTRKFVRVVSASTENQSTRIRLINDAMEKFRLRETFKRAAEVDGAYGRCNLYVDVGPLSEEEKRAPLVLTREAVPLRSLRGFKVIEPFWTYPAWYDAQDPTAEHFYLPRSWYVMGTEWHRTRMLPFVGREVPDILKPAYAFGGLSLTQMVKPYVDHWVRMRQNVGDVVENFAQDVLHTDLDSALSGAGSDPSSDPGDELDLRLSLYNAIKSVRGLMVLNKDTETFETVAKPLGTLDHLLAQAQEQMCSVAAVPLVKYLGIQPSGLNASSEGEIRVFFDTVIAQAGRLFGPHLKRVIDLIMLSELGAVNPDISYRFEALWEMSEKERADLRKTNADAASVYVKDGVLHPAEERERLANEEDGLYNNIDPDDVPEPPQPPQPPGADPFGGDDPEGGPPGSPGGAPEAPEVPTVAGDEGWQEHLHPRAKDGKFTSGPGASSAELAPKVHPKGYAPGGEAFKAMLKLRHHVGLADELEGEAKLAALKAAKKKLGEKYGIGHQYLDALIKEHGEAGKASGLPSEETEAAWGFGSKAKAPDLVYGPDGQPKPEGKPEGEPDLAALKEALPSAYKGYTKVWDGQDLDELKEVKANWEAGNEPEVVAYLDALIKKEEGGAEPGGLELDDPFQDTDDLGKAATPPVPEKLEGLKKVGAQKGSNPGGVYEDAAGNRFYVKMSKSDDHARNEWLASQLYQAAGSPVVPVHLIDVGGGKLGTVSPWTEHEGAFKPGDAAHHAEAAQDFATHAWLGNWDAVGLENDNQVFMKGGVLHTVDVGGSLKYRAQGAAKTADEFGDEVKELETMKALGTAGKVFGSMTPGQLKASAQKVAKLDDDKIVALCKQSGVKDWDALATRLITRKADLLKKAGATPDTSPKAAPTPGGAHPAVLAAAKEFKHKVDPRKYGGASMKSIATKAQAAVTQLVKEHGHDPAAFSAAAGELADAMAKKANHGAPAKHLKAAAQAAAKASAPAAQSAGGAKAPPPQAKADPKEAYEKLEGLHLDAEEGTPASASWEKLTPAEQAAAKDYASKNKVHSDLESTLKPMKPSQAALDLKKNVEDNLDKVLVKNKPAVEGKLAQVEVALSASDPAAAVKALQPIPTPKGMAQGKVNELIAKLKEDHGVAPPKPQPPGVAITPAEQSHYEKALADPPKPIHREFQGAGADGKPVKSVIKTDPSKVPGDWHAKVAAKLQGNAEHGDHAVEALNPVMQAYYDEVVSKQTTPEEESSIAAYQGVTYKSINKGLNHPPPDADAKEHIENISAAIAKTATPAALPVWRGINATLGSLVHHAGVESPAELVGKSFVHKNFASVARRKQTSVNFAQNGPSEQAILLKFHLPAGAPGLVMNHQSGETEIVLDKAAMFRIDKVESGAGHGVAHLLHVTYLGHKK